MKNSCALVLVLISIVATYSHAQFNGVPFADDTAMCSLQTEAVSAAQRDVIANTMGQHQARLYHWLWHSTRNGWTSLTPTEQQLMKTVSPEWGSSAPLCPSPDISGSNPAGEEFLRMHHMMIDFMRKQLVDARLPCIGSWAAIPQLGDPNWPLPIGLTNDSSKSNEVGRLIQSWSATFMSRQFLVSHSLSQVGYLLEFSIHNNMHMRFAEPARPGDDFSPLAAGVNSVDGLMAASPFDAANYNYLGNPYSSAANPVFWKLHGWVDGVVVAWLRENGFTSIRDACPPQDRQCYQWRSQWVGGMSGVHNHGGGPRGGGMADPRGMSRASPQLGSALEKLENSAPFRNPEFERFLSSPRGGKGPPTGGAVPVPGAGTETTAPLDSLNDPAIFVKRFGPCANMPEFLR